MKLQRYIFAFIAIILGIFSSKAVAADDVNGADWKYYSAFYSNPHRIIDGTRYTYFFVYQQKYNSTDDILVWGQPCGTLLYYDKENPEAGIHSAHDRFQLSGMHMTMADYNPRTGLLIIFYKDGGIDLVEDNGTVTYLTDLKDRSDFAQSAPVSISFDLYNDIWIALSNGFMHIDGTAKKVVEAPRYGVKVNSINRVGDRVVAWMNTDIYDASINSDLRDVYSFTPTGIATNRQPQCFMPLNDTAFAFVGTQGVALATVFIAKYSTSTESWSTEAKIADKLSTTGLDTNTYYGNSLENNVINTPDGYFLFNKTYAYHISLGLTDEGSLNYQKRKLFWTNMKVYASADFETFWYYIQEGKFCIKKADDNYGDSTKWTAVGADMCPNGPRAFRRVNFEYSPDFGMLTVNRGRDLDSEFEKAYPVLLAGLKDSKWTDYSAPFVTPTFTTDGTSYTGTYGKYRYPAYDPNDFVIDPVFPNWVFMGSFYNGVFAINLENPTGAALHWSNSQDVNANLPGFSQYFLDSSWKGVLPIRVAGYDADNTLWILYNNAWHSPTKTNRTSFMYLTVDARKAALENQNIEECGEWGELVCSGYTYGKDNALALKHANNKGKLLYFSSNDDRQLYIYDHKGTLEDTSDDTETMFTEFLNPYGGLKEFSVIYDMTEDPVTGEVYIAHDGGVEVINPCDTLVNGAMPSHPLSITGPDDSPEYIGVASGVYAISIDEYNRIWVSTITSGVYGINAERTEVIAHYITSNSGIPNNTVYGTCWNPATQELFISTEAGLASVKPDKPAANAAEVSLKAYPTSVDENYAGTITVYNVSGISTIKVKDTQDNVVAMLPVPENNTTYWNLLNEDGKEVPSGRYTIYDANGFYKSVEVTVVR